MHSEQKDKMVVPVACMRLYNVELH